MTPEEHRKTLEWLDEHDREYFRNWLVNNGLSAAKAHTVDEMRRLMDPNAP